MRELLVFSALVWALQAAVLPADPESQYKCLQDQDDTAKAAAEKFINARHRHGYRFKVVSLDSRSPKEKSDPCEVVFGLTLEETECHVVNPKPLEECNVRLETETKVTAKCNVTVSSAEGKPDVRQYICDTEPASHEILVRKCPDCPSLLPLHDPKALEGVKSALQKFNKKSNHKSYFKLLEVGRISTQWMFSGQSYFAQFAIMETNCPNKETSENQEECKALCGEQARYGFCKSSKVGAEEPEVDCEIYEAQNFTHPMQHPTQSRRDCKFHGPPPPHGHGGNDKGHGHGGNDKGHGHGGNDKGHGHGGNDRGHGHGGNDKGHGGNDKGHGGNDRGHGGNDKGHGGNDKGHGHGGNDKGHGHGGNDRNDKIPPPGGRPGHGGNDRGDRRHDHRGHGEHPHMCPKGPSGVPESAPEGRFEFPCHGFVKIPPSIYPICPFPPPRLCLPNLTRPSIPPPPSPPPKTK